MEANSFTYAVDRHAEGRYRLRRIFLITLYVLFVLVSFVVIYITRIPQVFALCPLFLFILVFYTWRYCQVTNEYVIEVGEISFTRIYGNRKRRPFLCLPIRSLARIAPQKDFALNRYRRVYDFRRTVTSPDNYAAEFVNERDERCLVLFEGTKKALRLFRLYNAAATTVKQDLTY